MDVLVGPNKTEFQEFSVKTEPVSNNWFNKMWLFYVSYLSNRFFGMKLAILVRLKFAGIFIFTVMNTEKTCGLNRLWPDPTGFQIWKQKQVVLEIKKWEHTVLQSVR